MKETDMFDPVKKLLEELGCSNVYGEIMNFDVVGLRGPADVIVEMKKTLNFKVIEQFPCRENAISLTKIDEAIMWQNKRTEDRLKRGVEGESKV